MVRVRPSLPVFGKKARRVIRGEYSPAWGCAAVRCWSEGERPGMRRPVGRLNLGQYLLLGFHGALWYEEAEELPCKGPDAEVARGTGRTGEPGGPRGPRCRVA